MYDVMYDDLPFWKRWLSIATLNYHKVYNVYYIYIYIYRRYIISMLYGDEITIEI